MLILSRALGACPIPYIYIPRSVLACRFVVLISPSKLLGEQELYTLPVYNSEQWLRQTERLPRRTFAVSACFVVLKSQYSHASGLYTQKPKKQEGYTPPL